VKITEYIFLPQIVDKLQRKHNVQTQEVIEVFNNYPLIKFIEKGHYQDENVYGAYGQTLSGRYLVIFFVYKQNKKALILSARGMTNVERKTYQRQQ
jgi:uncharacterized protein